MVVDVVRCWGYLALLDVYVEAQVCHSLPLENDQFTSHGFAGFADVEIHGARKLSVIV